MFWKFLFSAESNTRYSNNKYYFASNDQNVTLNEIHYSSVIKEFNKFLETLLSQPVYTTWTSDINWTYIRRSEDVQERSETSSKCLIYVQFMSFVRDWGALENNCLVYSIYSYRKSTNRKKPLNLQDMTFRASYRAQKIYHVYVDVLEKIFRGTRTCKLRNHNISKIKTMTIEKQV